MNKTMHGVIHGKTIQLETDPGLADGQHVDIIVRLPPTAAKKPSVNKLPNWYCCDLPDSAILSGCWMQLLFIGYEKSTRR